MSFFEERIEKFKLLEKEEEKILEAAKIIKNALFEGKKVFFAGNGGSAAECNHLAAEFVVKFEKERKSHCAISLCANNSIITACANDFSFSEIFARQIEGLAQSGDVLVALSTSGKSENVLKALLKAKNLGLKTIFLAGEQKSTFLEPDIEINAPSAQTAVVQEMHLMILHKICEILEF